jgi:hypothetical protein
MLVYAETNHSMSENKHLALKPSIGPRRISSAFGCAMLLWGISLDSVAQDRQRRQHTEVIPWVGTIKDYPTTGLMTGCGTVGDADC